MASARFRIGTAATNSAGTSWSWRSYDAPADVQAGSYCKVSLESNDVSTIQVTIPSTDELSTAPTVTTNQSAKTATFRATATTGHTYLVRVVVNSGVDSNGDDVADYTKQLGVHVLTSGGKRLLAIGERDEADRTWGYLPKLNQSIRDVATQTWGVSATNDVATSASIVVTPGYAARVIATVVVSLTSGSGVYSYTAAANQWAASAGSVHLRYRATGTTSVNVGIRLDKVSAVL